MNYRFYSMLQIVLPRSKTETLHNLLRSTHFPELEDITPLKNLLRNNPHALARVKDDLMISGYYCLYDGNTLLSIATIKKNSIDRVMTMPEFRRQGHALRLINRIKAKFLTPDVWMFCPVAPHAESLFERAGWVRCGAGAPDGSTDYCPLECVASYTGQGGGGVQVDLTHWVHHLLGIQDI